MLTLFEREPEMREYCNFDGQERDDRLLKLGAYESSGYKCLSESPINECGWALGPAGLVRWSRYSSVLGDRERQVIYRWRS